MKTLIIPAISAVLLLAATHQSDAQPTVEFGPLYGNDSTNFPTSVIDGDGDSLGMSLEGVDLWFICLDREADDPSQIDPYQWEYALSTDNAILTSGDWSTYADRNSILNGVTNIFFNNASEIYADTASTGGYDTPGSAMQYAAWAIIDNYGTVWNGELNQAAIDAIIDFDPSIPDTLVADYLASSLVANSDATGRVIFGNPAGATPGDYQTIMLISPNPIPEPSGAILLGMAGMFFVLGRRRKM